MKPHPRIRKTVKWGGLFVSVLLLTALIGSGWWCLEVETPRSGYVIIQSGRLCIAEPLFEGWGEGEAAVWLEPLPVPLRWGGRWGKWNGGRAIALPLWIPAGACVVTTAAAWRLDSQSRRRARAGNCPKCSYDRAGLAPGGVCPECGASSAGARA